MRKKEAINFEIDELNKKKEELETEIEEINNKIEKLGLEIHENNFYSLAYKYKNILLKVEEFLKLEKEIKEFYNEKIIVKNGDICTADNFCDRCYYTAYQEKTCPFVPICAFFDDDDNYLEEFKEIFEKLKK